MKYVLTVILALLFSFNPKKQVSLPLQAQKQRVVVCKVITPKLDTCKVIIEKKEVTSYKATKAEIRFITKFSAYDSVFKAYNINPVTAITMALIEQGARDMKGYRHFNIAYTSILPTSYHTGYTLVTEKGKKRKYRAYSSLDSAVLDYCSIISRLENYKKALKKLDYSYQISTIARGGYAENPDYEKVVLAKAKKVSFIYNKVKPNP